MNPDIAGVRSERDPVDRGSGTVLALTLSFVMVVLTAMVVVLAQAAGLAQRVASAADLAALAGADAARGLTAGDPCILAAETAARQGASLVSCTVEKGEIVAVRTEARQRSPFGAATGRARAGPPP
ncbi:Rv3654c family TadE-like protein [bacterium RCC_150]